MSDYRDKAAELRRQVVWASNEAIDAISQALLEAHKAGREEMAGDIAETVNQMLLDTKSIRQEGPADMERAGRVVAKLMDGYSAIARLVDAASHP